jgi:hypothetical protein
MNFTDKGMIFNWMVVKKSSDATTIVALIIESPLKNGRYFFSSLHQVPVVFSMVQGTTSRLLSFIFATILYQHLHFAPHN